MQLLTLYIFQASLSVTEQLRQPRLPLACGRLVCSRLWIIISLYLLSSSRVIPSSTGWLYTRQPRQRFITIVTVYLLEPGASFRGLQVQGLFIPVLDSTVTHASGRQWVINLPQSKRLSGGRRQLDKRFFLLRSHALTNFYLPSFSSLVDGSETVTTSLLLKSTLIMSGYRIRQWMISDKQANSSAPFFPRRSLVQVDFQSNSGHSYWETAAQPKSMHASNLWFLVEFPRFETGRIPDWHWLQDLRQKETAWESQRCRTSH